MSEFDNYAHNYQAGMENPLKKLAGQNPEAFMQLKINWFLRYFNHNLEPKNANILDFGCGSGTFLNCLSKTTSQLNLYGCDVSKKMLEECRAKLKPNTEVNLEAYDGIHLPYQDHSFHFIVANAVFHHIPVADRTSVYEEIWRVLKQNGYFFIFEHNPFNPVTRWVVAHTPIDQNAVLLKPSEIKNSTKHLSGHFECYYLMFFPPRLHFLQGVEWLIKSLPLGGQFVTIIKKL